MARTVYHVVPDNDGSGWAVKKQGASRASSTHRKKTAAVRKGKRLAKRRKPSQVVIHGKDGSIQTEHTYQGDEFPPRG